MKIENEVSNSFYNLYILKEVVDSAREVRPDYMNKQTREKSIHTFKNLILDKISKVAKFCNPKNINFEKMLCSILLLAKNIEGVLYNVIENRIEEKYKEYDQLDFENIEEIYGIIETTIPDEYVFNEKSKIMVIDNIKKENRIIDLDEDIVKNLNELDNLSKGCYIYDNDKCK